MLFEQVTPTQKKRWQRDYKSMMDQIGVNFPGGQLIIKNPHNTGRVQELLELYPKAKFVYLYRHPYEVYPSTYLMYDRVVKTQYLHDYKSEDTEQKIFYYYKSIIARYLEYRKIIPRDSLIEISYHELISNPKNILLSIYSKFKLNMDKETHNKVDKYLDEQKKYKINRHELRPEIKDQILSNLDFIFQEYGFER